MNQTIVDPTVLLNQWTVSSRSSHRTRTSALPSSRRSLFSDSELRVHKKFGDKRRVNDYRTTCFVQWIGSDLSFVVFLNWDKDLPSSTLYNTRRRVWLSNTPLPPPFRYHLYKFSSRCLFGGLQLLYLLDLDGILIESEGWTAIVIHVLVVSATIYFNIYLYSTLPSYVNSLVNSGRSNGQTSRTLLIGGKCIKTILVIGSKIESSNRRRLLADKVTFYNTFDLGRPRRTVVTCIGKVLPREVLLCRITRHPVLIHVFRYLVTKIDR